jgi:murein DD-endopeptidase MepM/ murein hydrolase activator NlpD
VKRIALVILISMTCLGSLYFSFLLAGTAVVADAMPAWARDEAMAWILGTPQPTGKDPGLPGGSSFSSGSFYWAFEGYAGLQSFICMMPVEGPARMSSCFGDTEGRDGRAHTGIDWATNHEQERLVWTPFGGKVTFAGWNTYLGWTVVIENEGWQVILGHLCCGPSGKSSAPTGPSNIQVSAGDIVQAGTVIGLSGNTGNSTGPHLHFEVRNCKPSGTCGVMNPNTVLLPGQDAPCPWESFSDSPASRCVRD